MSDPVEKKVSEEPKDNAAKSRHNVPAVMLVGLFLMLLGLTWITVQVSRQDLGGFNVHVSLGIAAFQGTLVALFFMRLPWERSSQGALLLGSLVFAALFVALCMIDVDEYKPTLDPTSTPVQEKLDQGRQSLTDPNF